MIVRIPLIIPDDNLPSQSSYYRSMIMRAIARGLEQDLLTRRWQWLDLPNRWFREIGYMQELKRVMPYAKYISLKKNSTRKIKMGGSYFTGRVDDITASELEINDTVLEITLRHLLSNNKRDHDFIFVIDELDKLNNSDKEIHAEQIAMLLKNLFNETGVHAVFISDEPTLGRIMESIRKDPFCAEKTLFKDLLLLNQMHPNEFSKLVLKYTGQVDPKTHRNHVSSLSLYTSLMPSEIERLYLQSGFDIDNFESSQKSIMGVYEYSYASTMQAIVNHLYIEYCNKHGQYYNRILFKALVEAGNNILQERILYFKWGNWISILYPSDCFTDETHERNEKNSNKYSSLVTTPEIIGLIEKLSTDEKNSIEDSLRKLIIILDRLGFLEIILEDITLIRLVSFAGDGFLTENLPEDFRDVIKPSESELIQIQRINSIGPVFMKVFGTAVWSKWWPCPFDIPNSHHGGGVKPFDQDMLLDRTLSCFWKKIEEDLYTVDEAIANELSQRIMQKLKAASASREVNSDGSFDIFIPNPRYGNKIKVIIYYGQGREFNISGYEKVFVLHSRSHRYKNKQTKRIKKYLMSDNWEPFDETIEDISKRIGVIINKRT